jgi:hypothetical protein
MFNLSVGCFAVAAVLGATMALRFFTQKGIQLPMALLHGVFAAAGLALLAVGGMQASFPGRTGLALGLFLVAAVGGFIMFGRHLMRLAMIPALIVIHGGAAVVSFLILVTSVYSA